MTNSLLKFLIRCSGANYKILSKSACATELGKYARSGTTILLTAIFASASGGYAFFTVFKSSQLAIACAMLWGATIFNLDQSIVTNMVKTKGNLGKQICVAMPRILMASVISVGISVPMELRLFQNEINYEITKENTKAAMEAEKKLAERFSEIPKLEEKNKQLQAETTAKEDERRIRYEEFKSEAEGTGGTYKIGTGPVSAEKKAEFDEVDRSLNTLRQKNDRLIEENRNEIKKLQEEKAKELQKITSAAENANSFLMQFSTLEKLSETNPAINTASWFVRLLFLMVETAPVLVKLMSSYGPYDVILARKQGEVIYREQRRIDDLEYTVDREAEENREMSETMRGSIREQFHKAATDAAIHPKWKETVDKVAYEIATKAQKELLEYVRRFRFVNPKLAKDLEQEYSKYQEEMTPVVVKGKVVRMKFDRVNRGLRNLRRFVRSLSK